jgi:hypothetical protein
VSKADEEDAVKKVPKKLADPWFSFCFLSLWRLFQTKAFQMLGDDVTPSVSLPPFGHHQIITLLNCLLSIFFRLLNSSKSTVNDALLKQRKVQI